MRPRCLCLLSAVLVLFGCANMTDTSGGGGSEVEIVGKLYESNGGPASGVIVRIIPSGFDPMNQGTMPEPLIDTTSAYGTYTIQGVDTGTYTILAQRSSDGTAALITGVTAQGDLCIVPPDTMEKTGTIKAAVPDSLDKVNGYLYIPGTGIAVSLNGSGGYVVFNSIPPGRIPAIIYGVRSSQTSRVFRYDIMVAPGDTVLAAMLGWEYARNLLLNTTAGGAGVYGSVVRFPVLVRLTSSNFNFAQAKPDGSDLRFAKSDGSPLPYEIEHWNSATELAEVWVRADTVYGNNNAQYIVIYWGRAQAAAASDAAAVFDTSSGFQGVWHMGQAGNAPALDATANGFTGTPFYMTAASSVNGMIGRAQYFNGVSSYIEVSNSKTGKLNFPENGTYSLSAWVYVDTLILPNGNVFISKGDFQYNLEVDRENNFWHMSEYHDGVGLQRTGTPATARAWTLVTGVRNGTSMTLYINGQHPSCYSWTNTNSFVQDTAFNVCFGKMANVMERYMFGTLDEIRISSVSYTPDWIRLCYMNQRPDDKLVVFKIE